MRAITAAPSPRSEGEVGAAVMAVAVQAVGTGLAGRGPRWFWPAQAATLVGGGIVAWRRGAGRRRPHPGELGRALAAGVAWYAGVVTVAAAVGRLPWGHRLLADVDRRRRAVPLGWRLAVLPLAAAGEELVWRGQVLRACRRRLGNRTGGTCGVMAAGAAQLLAANPLFPLAATGWGAIAGPLSDGGESVWPAAVAHAAWGLLALGWPGLPEAARDL